MENQPESNDQDNSVFLQVADIDVCLLSVNYRTRYSINQALWRVQLQNLHLQMENLQNKSPSFKLKTGRWTRAEHNKFMQALEKHGRNWILVQRKVKTRTLLQIRSHAQKVFLNMYEKDIDALIGHDESNEQEKNEAKQKKNQVIKNRSPSPLLFEEDITQKHDDTKNNKQTRPSAGDAQNQGLFEEKQKSNGNKALKRKNYQDEFRNQITYTDHSYVNNIQSLGYNNAGSVPQLLYFSFNPATFYYYPPPY